MEAIPMFLGHAVLKEAILGVYQYLGERSHLNGLDQPKAIFFPRWLLLLKCVFTFAWSKVLILHTSLLNMHWT